MEGKMKKRIGSCLGMFFLLLLFMSLVTACSKKETVEASSSQTLDIAIFEGGWGRSYWDDRVAKFTAAHPGLTINMNVSPEIAQILAPQLSAGEWPDFISVSQGSTDGGLIESMIKNRELLNLASLFESDAPDRSGKKLKDIMYPGVLESSRVQPYKDGQLLFAPLATGPMGLVYNKNLFDAKGWKVPATWDEFFALDEELKKPENYVVIDGKPIKRSLYTYQGIYASYNEMLLWPGIASVAGTQALQDISSYKEGSFDNAAVKSVVEVLAKFSEKDYLMEGTVGLNHTQSQTDMMLGKALFIPNGTWMEAEMADAPREPGFEFAMTAVPTINAGQTRYAMASMDTVEIPTNAKNPELAQEFLKSIYSKESIISFAQNANGVIAAADGAEIAKDYLTPGTYGMFSVFDDASFLVFGWDALPPDTKVDVARTVFEDNIGLVFTGKMSPDEYIKRIEAAFAEVREEMARAQ
jgi:N-acetylglucosamine transport system substrate-binding protein